MQKYRTTEYLDLLIDGEAHAVDSGFDHDQPVYLASDVDKFRNDMHDIIGSNGRQLSQMVEMVSQQSARIAELRDIVRQAEKDVLSSAGICLACGEMDEGDGEPEHAKDCWIPRARDLLRVL